MSSDPPHSGEALAPSFPFPPLPPIGAALLREVEAAAFAANDRYLVEHVEGHSFCPFARGGRMQGATTRFVHYCDSLDAAPLVELMRRSAATPRWEVVQVIMPGIEVTPEAWLGFCREITAYCNARLDGGKDVYAVAALHPRLAYDTASPYALIPLFRRAPDPTIQWVRLDSLDAIYAGREMDAVYVDPDNIEAFLKKKPRPPLFQRIAEVNMQEAQRLGIDNVDKALAEISESSGCPRGGSRKT